LLGWAIGTLGIFASEALLSRIRGGKTDRDEQQVESE
jgi:hypothetical protein